MVSCSSAKRKGWITNNTDRKKKSFFRLNTAHLLLGHIFYITFINRRQRNFIIAIRESAFAGRIFGRNITFLEYKDALDAVKISAMMQFGQGQLRCRLLTTCFSGPGILILGPQSPAEVSLFAAAGFLFSVKGLLLLPETLPPNLSLLTFLQNHLF
jgi:hypothetical protein